ncbi:MAG: DUF1385 domain-containing protein [Coriobacteriales bacterium]|jgi:uncharacterized protein YqhQ
MAERESRRGELKRAEETEGVLVQTHIGGQALIEGVMMRGKYSWAAAIRTPEGDIYTEEHDLQATRDKHGWLYWPVVRGCRALVESLLLGYKALSVASEHAFDFEEDEKDEKKAAEAAETAGAAAAEPVAAASEGGEPVLGKVADAVRAAAADARDADASVTVDEALDAIEPAAAAATPEPIAANEASLEPAAELAAVAAEPAPKPTAKPVSAKADDAKKDSEEGKSVMIVGSVLGIVLGLALFIMLPAWLTNFIVGNYDEHVVVWNIVDGLLRVGVFIFYVWLIARMKDIKRMFRYHGAEHKTIHCYEHGLELTPENAQQFPTLHVRCGTAFLITTLIIAIIVFSMVPVKAICAGLGLTGVGQFVVIVLTRIIFIPLVAGLGYELTVKWAGSHPERKLVRIVLWPGLQMQKLTTAQPDEGMLECAIAAMKLVIAREELEERKAAAGEKAAEPVPAPFCGDVAASTAASE